MTTFNIVDRETNNWIVDSFSTLEEAEAKLAEYEANDTQDGTYEPDFYQIVEA